MYLITFINRNLDPINVTVYELSNCVSLLLVRVFYRSILSPSSILIFEQS